MYSKKQKFLRGRNHGGVGTFIGVRLSFTKLTQVKDGRVTSPVSLPCGGRLGGPLRDLPDAAVLPPERQVDTLAHESNKWELGPREHTLSGILTLTFRAAIGLKEKIVTGELSVWCSTSLTCTAGSNEQLCFIVMSIYGVAHISKSPRRTLAAPACSPRLRHGWGR